MSVAEGSIVKDSTVYASDLRLYGRVVRLLRQFAVLKIKNGTIVHADRKRIWLVDLVEYLTENPPASSDEDASETTVPPTATATPIIEQPPLLPYGTPILTGALVYITNNVRKPKSASPDWTTWKERHAIVMLDLHSVRIRLTTLNGTKTFRDIKNIRVVDCDRTNYTVQLPLPPDSSDEEEDEKPDSSDEEEDEEPDSSDDSIDSDNPGAYFEHFPSPPESSDEEEDESDEGMDSDNPGAYFE